MRVSETTTMSYSGSSIRRHRTSALSFLAVFAVSWQATYAAEPMPDLSLMDVNPTSATHSQMVSPREFAGVSGWYFGHST